MIGFLQRVTQAEVAIDGDCVGRIDTGLMVLMGIRPEDTEAKAQALVERLLAYRVFPDAQGRMNRSLRDIAGGLLLVPQFTLCADTRRGLRPGFEGAARPEQAQPLFEVACAHAHAVHSGMVASGRFGADMQVALINDGPVSFWLEV
ncbi:D-aminoacyl-tRNA deacylase [Algiphilus sp.]|uniref:D-aminoacyl-tRNA deacylase n=1 Tax=Algiphilus sp. TaxID=1872431 RepID=UPI002A615810|nr:D-aminoacyl-tRNA deacylase [Pseudomonadota bacterium]